MEQEKLPFWNASGEETPETDTPAAEPLQPEIECGPEDHRGKAKPEQNPHPAGCGKARLAEPVATNGGAGRG
jgi:hypothetical protein